MPPRDSLRQPVRNQVRRFAQHDVRAELLENTREQIATAGELVSDLLFSVVVAVPALEILLRLAPVEQIVAGRLVEIQAGQLFQRCHISHRTRSQTHFRDEVVQREVGDVAPQMRLMLEVVAFMMAQHGDDPMIDRKITRHLGVNARDP